MPIINRSSSRVLALVAAAILIAAACSPAASTAPTATQAATTGPQPSPTEGVIVTPVPGQGGMTSDGRPLIRWFVGLGTGERPNHIAVEQAVVDAYNVDHPETVVSLEIYRNAVAYDTLATQIATGNAPDIIGPIGIRALQSFGDQLLDLTPYITEADLADMPQGLVDVYKVDGKQIGIPMAVYPSFFYYNKALFDEADLPYPPHEVGEEYDGQPWTWEAVAELAKKLTVDADGNDATSPDFDPENIVQYGLDAQWTENDARAWGTVYGGSGSIVAADGTTAQFPENWQTGLEFMYDGIWTDHFIPNKAAVDGMAGGNSFQSGQIAMDVVHLWFTCCVYPAEGTPPVTDWDIAVLPTGPDGNVTSKLHADTIGILASSYHPDIAFEVLTYLSGSPELTNIYGAMPARASAQDTFFTDLQTSQDATRATFGLDPLAIDWDVAKAMLEFPDTPSHESYMPNFARADAANKALGSKLWTTPGLDVGAEIDALIQELNTIFAGG